MTWNTPWNILFIKHDDSLIAIINRRDQCFKVKIGKILNKSNFSLTNESRCLITGALTVNKTSKSGKSMHKYVKTARKGIGRKGLTQKALAKMVGVHHTLISRRERGEVNVEGTTAEPLYKLVDSLCADGLNMEVEEVLLNLSEPKTEDKALMAMVLLAFEQGKAGAVQSVLKDDKKKVIDTGFDAAHTLRVLSSMRESLEKYALEKAKSGDPMASALKDLAKSFSSLETETRMVKAQIGDDEKGDE